MPQSSIMPFVTPFIIAFLSLAAPQSDDNVWVKPIAPQRIAGNIHYVGSAELSSYLITTPEGHILIETGDARYADTLLANIRTLGFKPTDVKILLTTQAHLDHVGGHAAVRKATGAQVMVMEGDADIVAAGGKGDFHFGADYYFPAATVDRVLHDGDVVRLGGVELRAHRTPGHTKGATSFTMTMREAGAERRVLFPASTSVNPGVKLVDNPKYPAIAADYAKTFEALAALPCDYCLTAHLSQMDGLAKLEALRKGASPNPFLNGAEFKKGLAESEERFRAELQKQSAR
jgi:metallo-beta-lactamase class B